MYPTRSLVFRRTLVWGAVVVALITSGCSVGTEPGGETSGQPRNQELSNQEPNTFVVLADNASPVVTIYDVNGELLHTVEFNAERVWLLPASTYGSHAVILIDRSDGGRDSAVLLDAATGENVRITAGGELFRDLIQIGGNRWHATFLVFDLEASWAAANLATGDIFRPTNPAEQSGPNFSADESVIVYPRANGTVWLVDTATLLETQILTDSAPARGLLPVSHGGSRVVWFDGSRDTRAAHIADLDTGETIDLPAVRFAIWLSDDLLLTEFDDGYTTVDARTGEPLLTLSVKIDKRTVQNSRALLENPRDGLVQVIDLETGEITDHVVPDRTEMATAFDRNDRFLWGSPNGRAGVVGLLEGWIYDAATGDVAIFEHPIADNGFFALTDAAFNIDQSVAVVEVGGTFYRIDSDGTVTTIGGEERSRPALCPNGDIVSLSRDGATSELLSADDYRPLATFGPGTQALCLTEAG